MIHFDRIYKVTYVGIGEYYFIPEVDGKMVRLRYVATDVEYSQWFENNGWVELQELTPWKADEVDLLKVYLEL